MEIFEARSNDGSIKSGLVSGEGFYISKISEEFSSVDELEDEIEIS